MGGDALFVIPIGDLASGSGPQLGALVRFGYRVIPELEVTGRIGYIYGFTKEQNGIDYGISNAPIWGGARYFFMTDPQVGVYAAAEMGVNFLNTRIDSDRGSGSSSSTRFGLNVGAGYVLGRDLPLDFRVQFIHYNVLGSSNDSAALGLGLSAGYTFQL